jgi:hypothetical protein
MTSPYNPGGSISCGASREHIERALLNYGATDVHFGQLENRSVIAFRGEGRQFRLVLSLPEPAGTPPIPRDTAEGNKPEARAKIRERASRRLWHALALAIDAKLGAAADGTTTLESEFLAHVVLPGNRTVLDDLQPIIDGAYRSGRHPFGDSAPPLQAAEPRISADSPQLRMMVDPTAFEPAQLQSLQDLSAQGVGRILLHMVQILDDRDNLTRQQMLEIIDHELGRDQLGGGPAGHQLKHAGSALRGSSLRSVQAPE